MKDSSLKHLALVLLLLAGVTRNVTAADALSLQTRVVQQVEMGQVTWFDVQCRLGTFSLIPPAHWRLQVRAAEGALCFQAPDLLSLIRIRFSPGALAAAGTNRAEAARQVVQRAYPGAAIVEEFPSFSSLAPAHTCDVRWKAGRDVEMAVRLAVVPCPGGAIEFHLNARPEAIKQYYPHLASLMVSFSQAPSGNDRQPPHLAAPAEKTP